MVPAMHQLIRESILSVKPLMQRAKREHTFEIFGCGALPSSLRVALAQSEPPRATVGAVLCALGMLTDWLAWF